MQELQADFQTTQQWKDLDKAARCIQAAFLRRWASSAHAAACKNSRTMASSQITTILEKSVMIKRLLLQAKYPKWYVSCQKRVFINVHYAFKEEAKKDYRAQMGSREKVLVCLERHSTSCDGYCTLWQAIMSSIGGCLAVGKVVVVSCKVIKNKFFILFFI